MNTIKKIMFMSGNKNEGLMGILKLERKNNNTFCNIKTYNDTFSGNYILGIKNNNNIIKQNINLDNQSYSFISQEIKNLDDIQGCVLIQISNGEFKPVLWGNNKDKDYKANIINSLRLSINNISNSKIKEQTKSTQLNKEEIINHLENDTTNTEEKNTNQTQAQYNIADNKKTNTPIQNEHGNEQISSDKNTTKNNDTITLIKKLAKLSSQQKLANNEQVYHPIKNVEKNKIESLSKIPLEEEPLEKTSIPEIAISCNASQLFESDDNEVENIIDYELKKDNESPHNFYNMIKDQLDELFDRYPPENNLNRLIDNSSWVKIDTDIVNKYYVVGIIKNNRDIKYICYGVPGNYNTEPPIEMRDYSQWLPTDITDPYTNGYWVMYQDADTGENIFIN